MKSVDLWECENCGRRAIGGRGEGWVADPEQPNERWHRCAGMAERLLPRPTVQVELDETGCALFDCVIGMDKWASDNDGVHHEAWDAYVAARKLLGLPPPPEERH